MSAVRLPMEQILLLRDALEEGRVAASAAYELKMAAGEFDKDLFDAEQRASLACITFRVWLLDKLPAVELEAA